MAPGACPHALHLPPPPPAGGAPPLGAPRAGTDDAAAPGAAGAESQDEVVDEQSRPEEGKGDDGAFSHSDSDVPKLGFDLGDLSAEPSGEASGEAPATSSPREADAPALPAGPLHLSPSPLSAAAATAQMLGAYLARLSSQRSSSAGDEQPLVTFPQGFGAMVCSLAAERQQETAEERGWLAGCWRTPTPAAAGAVAMSAWAGPTPPAQAGAKEDPGLGEALARMQQLDAQLAEVTSRQARLASPTAPGPAADPLEAALARERRRRRHASRVRQALRSVHPGGGKGPPEQAGSARPAAQAAAGAGCGTSSDGIITGSGSTGTGDGDANGTGPANLLPEQQALLDKVLATDEGLAGDNWFEAGGALEEVEVRLKALGSGGVAGAAAAAAAGGDGPAGGGEATPQAWVEDGGLPTADHVR